MHIPLARFGGHWAIWCRCGTGLMWWSLARRWSSWFQSMFKHSPMALSFGWMVVWLELLPYHDERTHQKLAVSSLGQLSPTHLLREISWCVQLGGSPRANLEQAVDIIYPLKSGDAWFILAAAAFWTWISSRKWTDVQVPRLNQSRPV